MHSHSILAATAKEVASRNFPLRGGKGSVWEGGTRSPSFIHAPFVPRLARNVDNSVIHVTDWLPTLYAAAGGEAADLPADIDGINQGLWP